MNTKTCVHLSQNYQQKINFTTKATQSALASSKEVGAGDWAADKHPLLKTPAGSPVPLSPSPALCRHLSTCAVIFAK